MEIDSEIFKKTEEGLVQLIRDSNSVLALTAAIKQKIPEETYRTLADMERYYEKFLIATQNIDRLHQKAGNKNVIELKGDKNDYDILEKGVETDIILLIGDFYSNPINKVILENLKIHSEFEPERIIISDTSNQFADYFTPNITKKWNEAMQLPSYKDFIDINFYKERYSNKEIDLETAHKMLGLSKTNLEKMGKYEAKSCIDKASQFKFKFTEGNLNDENHIFRRIWEAERILLDNYWHNWLRSNLPEDYFMER